MGEEGGVDFDFCTGERSKLGLNCDFAGMGKDNPKW